MTIKERLLANEKPVQKAINIDDKLYERIEKLSKDVYKQSISKIINECIYELADTENVRIYDGSNECLVKRSVMLSRRSLAELERLRNKYKLSMVKLVNIAVNNVIDELEN